MLTISYVLTLIIASTLHNRKYHTYLTFHFSNKMQIKQILRKCINFTAGDRIQA